MSPLPVVSGRDILIALRKLGYELDRQRGSHMILRQQTAPHRRLTVPDHKQVAKGTLMAIIRQAGLTVEEFERLILSLTRTVGEGRNDETCAGEIAGYIRP